MMMIYYNFIIIIVIVNYIVVVVVKHTNIQWKPFFYCTVYTTTDQQYCGECYKAEEQRQEDV